MFLRLKFSRKSCFNSQTDTTPTRLCLCSQAISLQWNLITVSAGSSAARSYPTRTMTLTLLQPLPTTVEAHSYLKNLENSFTSIEGLKAQSKALLIFSKRNNGSVLIPPTTLCSIGTQTMIRMA